jgi:hypothetical protein
MRVRSTGFIVGWSRFAAGLFSCHSVLCDLSPYQAQDPEVARYRHRRFWRVWDCIFVGQSSRRFVVGKPRGEFVIRETEDTRVVVGIFESLQFKTQEFIIPSGIQSKSVIRQDVGALLVFIKVTDNNRWYGCELQPLGSEQSSIARNHAGITVDQDWSIESKLANAGGNLRDLDIRLSPSVSRIRD